MSVLAKASVAIVSTTPVTSYYNVCPVSKFSGSSSCSPKLTSMVLKVMLKGRQHMTHRGIFVISIE